MMRASLLAIGALAGCGFPGTGIIADAGGADANGVRIWSLVTSADFELDASFESALTQRDLIEPMAWEIGGLFGRSANTQVITAGDEPWSLVSATTPNAATSIHLPFAYWNNTFPPGLGLDDGQNYTAWWEGEIFLEAGTHLFQLDADVAGFLEVAAEAGTVRYEDHFSTADPAATTSITTSGWYVIRIAVGNGTYPTWAIVTHQYPSTSVLGVLSAARVRTPAARIPGLLRKGFDEVGLGDGTGVTRADAALIDENYGSNYPDEVGITDNDTWSQRLAGQIWIDAGGMHTFHVDADAGYRMYVDGALISDPIVFDGNPHDDTLAPTTLARGWHDLVIDHQDFTGNTHLTVDLNGAPIAPTDLRPVVTGRDRTAVAHTTLPADPIPATMLTLIEAGTGTDLIELIVTYEIDHTTWQELEVTLTTAWGETELIRDNEAQSGDGQQVITKVIPKSQLAGNGAWQVSGLWQLAVADTVMGPSGSLIRWSITARYAGGSAAIARTARYTSGVHDFGAARSISGVVATASTPAGTSAQLAVRTCDAPPCSGAFMALSALPLPAARYGQLQVTMTSDGIAVPFVDDIDVYVLP